MKSTEVEVLLPKFKLQEDYDMESVLRRLGMVDAFQQGKADLSAMSAEGDLCLSKFVHKSFVEVNEEGTEAAAASGCVVIAECCMESGPGSVLTTLSFSSSGTTEPTAFCSVAGSHLHKGCTYSALSHFPLAVSPDPHYSSKRMGLESQVQR